MLNTNIQSTTYFDVDSVRKAGGYLYFWNLKNYLEPTKYSDLSFKTYKKIDCDSLGYQVLKFENYNSHKRSRNIFVQDLILWATKGKLTASSAGEDTNKIACKLAD